MQLLLPNLKRAVSQQIPICILIFIVSVGFYHGTVRPITINMCVRRRPFSFPALISRRQWRIHDWKFNRNVACVAGVSPTFASPLSPFPLKTPATQANRNVETRNRAHGPLMMYFAGLLHAGSSTQATLK